MPRNKKTADATAAFLDDITENTNAAAELAMPQLAEGFKNITVRLLSSDFRAFQRAAQDRGFGSMQAAMVYSVNRAMADWRQDPVSDPGTSKRATPGNPGPRRRR